MSQQPHYNMNRHTNTDGDEAVQRPRRPNPETEARLLHGTPPGWLAYLVLPKNVVAFSTFFFFYRNFTFWAVDDFSPADHC